MITRVGIATALFAALAAVAAAPPAPPAKTPSVDELVSKYVAARGGLSKIRAVKSLRQKGHVNAGPNKDGVVTREIKWPSSTRFEFRVQGVTSVFVSDGKQGWRVDPVQGDTAPTRLPDEAVREAAEQGDFEGPLVDWKAKGHKVELVGTENVGGRPAYNLKVTLKSGDVRHDYLDVQTKNLVRSDSTRLMRGRKVTVRTTFADFKKSDGLLFPRTVEVIAEGRPSVLHIDVQSIEVNPPLSDERFALPKSLRP